MAYNEALLGLTAAASASFVFLAWKLDKERLYSAIVVFLILISVAGSKLVDFFGHETNTGNIYYASVFLATYFLIERYGRREGIRSIGIGIMFVVGFTIFLQLVVGLDSAPGANAFGNALSAALNPASRLAFASLLAYAVSQYLNVQLYSYLKEHMEAIRGAIWIRANISNMLAQAVDSAIFFTVAFWGVVPPGNIWEVLLTGFVIKVVYILLASPLLYFNHIEEEAGGYVSVTVL